MIDPLRIKENVKRIKDSEAAAEQKRIDIYYDAKEKYTELIASLNSLFNNKLPAEILTDDEKFEIGIFKRTYRIGCGVDFVTYNITGESEARGTAYKQESFILNLEHDLSKLILKQ